MSQNGQCQSNCNSNNQTCNNNSGESLRSISQVHNHKIPWTVQIKNIFQNADERFMGIYNYLTNTTDMVISSVSLPMGLEKKIRTKQILFFLVMITNFFLLNNNITLNNTNYNYTFSSVTKYLNYTFFQFTTILLLILIVILKLPIYDAMYIKRNEELENFIIAKIPEIVKNRCEDCNIIKSLRSIHCHRCNRCVARFELHSEWFNTCIGSKNFLIYILLILTLSVNFTASYLSIFLQILVFGRSSELYDIKGKELSFHFWFIFMTLFTFKMLVYTEDFVNMGFRQNLTDYEGFSWRRLPHLWKSLRKEFYNPFDKGSLIKNLREYAINLWNPSIKLEDSVKLRLRSNENLSGSNSGGNSLNVSTAGNSAVEDDDLIIEVKSETEMSASSGNNDRNNQMSNDTNSTIKNIEDMDYFIPSDNSVVYRQYYGEEGDYINWNNTRFYSVMDIHNTPFRSIVVKLKENQANQ